MKNFAKPSAMEYKSVQFLFFFLSRIFFGKRLEEEKNFQNTNYFYEISKMEKNFEIPKKSQDYVFSFNNGKDDKSYSLLNEKLDKYYNLK